MEKQKLKWSKDEHGNVFDIRDGQSTFIISKGKKDLPRPHSLSIRIYGERIKIPTKYLTTAKKVAQLIHNG